MINDCYVCGGGITRDKCVCAKPDAPTCEHCGQQYCDCPDRHREPAPECPPDALAADALCSREPKPASGDTSKNPANVNVSAGHNEKSAENHGVASGGEARESLIGWMILEDHTEDMSHWSGVISYPDPTGANLAWENPTKMIEYAAYEAMRKELAETKKYLDATTGDAMCARAERDRAWAALEAAREQRDSFITSLHKDAGVDARTSLNIKSDCDDILERILGKSK